MKSTPMINVLPQKPMSLHDRLAFAYSSINKAIELTDGGRDCTTPVWSNMQDCRRIIREVMDRMRKGETKGSGLHKSISGECWQSPA